VNDRKENSSETKNTDNVTAQARSECSNGSTGNGTARPAIDVETLEQLRVMLGKDTPHMMAGLIENYLENTPKLLKSLGQVVESDRNQLSRAIYNLKCNSMTFGAMRLCALCEELENSHSAEEAAIKLVQIEAEYERVKVVLEAEWRRLYELRLKTDLFFPTGSYKNIGFYPPKSAEE
jgi:HPt (histidine-containing phosphotransfer) domain-containing protein